MSSAEPLSFHPPRRLPPPAPPRPSAPGNRPSSRRPHGPAAGTTKPPAIESYQRRLAAIAQVLRDWVPEIRQFAEALVPLLPSERTVWRMAGTERESLVVFLFTSTDSLIRDVLVPAIVELERRAHAVEPPASRVPDREEEERKDRVWRDVDPQAPRRGGRR